MLLYDSCLGCTKQAKGPYTACGTDDVTIFFALLGSVHVKVAHKILVKSTPSMSLHMVHNHVIESFFFHMCHLCYSGGALIQPMLPNKGCQRKKSVSSIACLQSSRPRFYCSVSVKVSDLWRPLKLSGRHVTKFL